MKQNEKQVLIHCLGRLKNKDYSNNIQKALIINTIIALWYGNENKYIYSPGQVVGLCLN